VLRNIATSSLTTHSSNQDNSMEENPNSPPIESVIIEKSDYDYSGNGCPCSSLLASKSRDLKEFESLISANSLSTQENKKIIVAPKTSLLSSSSKRNLEKVEIIEPNSTNKASSLSLSSNSSTSNTTESSIDLAEVKKIQNLAQETTKSLLLQQVANKQFPTLNYLQAYFSKLNSCNFY
jgi:hypothetical protein